MLSAILYIPFFLVLNLCIVSSLSGRFAIPVRIKTGVYAFTALFFVLHLVVAANGFLFPVRLFFILLMFSIAIVIMHFMAKRVAKRTDASIASNPRLAGSIAAVRFGQVRVSILTISFPAMIFLFQVLVICSPDLQYDVLHPDKEQVT